ncbi:hypothetical protein C1646_764285 [Rhizophagus diaphanus]|nr:hypothetical protein C1646_764285 [Rhizophagus diaphanus] [Rhizophagus sp. MUCL 43196]
MIYIINNKKLTESFGEIFWKVDSLKNNILEYEECEILYNRRITTTENTLQILKKQKVVRNSASNELS